MKKILLIIIFSLFGLSVYGQHIELVSNVTDSMALVSKEDIDIINNVFYERNILDSLNIVNEEIIRNLNLTSIELHKIIANQKVMIQNDSLIKDKYQILLDEREKIIQKYQKDIKSQKTQKTIWMSTSGGLAIALLIIILI